MFETGIRQFRLAMSMVWGTRVNTGNLDRLLADAVATMAEFGAPGEDLQELLDGPFADPDARHEFQNRGLRRTATRLARDSRFYAERFAAAGVDPAALTVDSVSTVPATLKRDLVQRPHDFLCAGSTGYLATRTTGTTGRPAQVWMSRYEADLWPALAALSGLLRNEINPADCMQVNISSRASAAVRLDLEICRLVGAGSRILGLVSPEESLDALLEGGERTPTLLSTYPSYLARLVTAARRRGLGPGEFRLRRVDVGGEALSPALAAATRATFGVDRVNDTFAMTEVLPVSGRTCDRRHLHHDLNMGLVEVVDTDTGAPTAPGELGSVVITPFYPYRECMPVFRYDTRDVVRALPDGPLGCELAGIPATSPIVGKADQILSTGRGRVTTRDLVEAIEALPTEPWPARFRAESLDGRLHLTLPATAVDGLTVAEVTAGLAGRGLDATVHTVPGDGRELRSVRADLVETTFGASTPPVPAAVTR